MRDPADPVITLTPPLGEVKPGRVLREIGSVALHIYTDREYVLAGGLMSLGVGHLDGYYRAASYADKILRGANPADLPIAPPTQVVFSVNRSALQDIGLTLPKEIADRVSEWLP